MGGGEKVSKAVLSVPLARVNWVHGKITYDDIFRKHHWLTYCATLTGNGEYTFRSYQNDSDNNWPCHGSYEERDDTYHPQNVALLPWLEFAQNSFAIDNAYSYPDETVLTGLSAPQALNCGQP